MLLFQPENMRPATFFEVFTPSVRGRIFSWFGILSNFLLGAAFLWACAIVLIRTDTDLPECALLLLGAASTMAAMTRQLPLQNVVLASVIIATIGTLMHTLGARSGIPFGAFMFGEEAGNQVFGAFPWTLPLLWIVAVLNSRGVARLILRPWRKIRAYGFWLLLLTALLSVLFDCALEPFATHERHYWVWTGSGYALTPQGGPLTNSIGWLAVTLLVLAFATPAMINKQLGKRSGVEVHPLLVWLGAVLFFTLGTAMEELWWAVVANVIILTVVAAAAIRGARW